MVMRKQLAGLILVAAAVAGCGSTSSSATLGSSGSSPSPVPSGVPAPIGSPSPDPLKTHGPSITPARVLPTTPPATPSGHMVSLPWQFLRLANGGKQIEISLDYGGCTSFNYAQVQQGTGSVEVTVWGTSTATSHTICPAFEAILRGSITLDSSLGTRQLLHGPVSRDRVTPMTQLTPMVP
jgi:hypothetical protein